jgi:hypothetical protein
MNSITIDPGYAADGEGCACSYLGNEETGLRWWFARPEGNVVARLRAHVPSWVSVDRVVWELPQQDQRSRSIPPSVLIALAAAGGQLAGFYAGLTVAGLIAVTPSASKGSVQKPIAHDRMWGALTPDERGILGGDATYATIQRAIDAGARERWRRPGVAYYPAKFLMHNILDSVALNLQQQGRLP